MGNSLKYCNAGELITAMTDGFPLSVGVYTPKTNRVTQQFLKFNIATRASKGPVTSNWEGGYKKGKWGASEVLPLQKGGGYKTF